MLQLKRILCPIDFSRCADQALAYALRLAAEHEAELHVLHVVTQAEGDPYGPLLHAAVGTGYPKRLDPIVKDLIREALERQDLSGVRVVPAWRRSYLAITPAVIAYVREMGIDLVVLGTHGRQGMKRMLMGSVAEEIIRTASCPVLTIREHPESIPVTEDFAHGVEPVALSENGF